MSTGVPAAATVSVTETVAMLDGAFSGLADGVARAEYGFWLGSGISLARVEGLRGVVRRVIEHLRSRIDPVDPDCRFGAALNEVLDLANLPAGKRALIDFADAVDTWPEHDHLVAALVNQYSAVLDVRVSGEQADYLLWDAVDVVATYAGAAVDPDVEHLCLAILAVEGVVPDLASANWDGLVELAVGQLGVAVESILKVCIVGPDFQGPSARTRLLKFHGCAVRAAAQPDPFRQLLIARQSQITTWPHDSAFANMLAELTSLAANTRTLMIGLSAQDSDIQDLFARARALNAWSWADPVPPHVFAEEELGPTQMNILKVVYADDYDEHSAEIYLASRMQAYAKPLLISLVLHVVCAKLRAFTQLVETSLSPAELSDLSDGLIVLRNDVAGQCGSDTLAFMHSFLGVASQLAAIFDTGSAFSPPPSRYRPVSGAPVHQAPSDPALANGGVREFGAALSLLGRGQDRGAWQLSLGGLTGPAAGACEVDSALGKTRVYLCADFESGARLIDSGAVDVTSDDAVVIYSRDPVARRRRSPSAPPGRTGRLGLREIGMAHLLREAHNLDDLEDRFAKATVI